MLNVKVPAAMNVWPSTLLTVPDRVWVVPAVTGEGIDTLVTWVAGAAPAWVPATGAITVPDPPTLDPDGGE
jgi:hypothetical protein